jgi:hypothetical protein
MKAIVATTGKYLAVAFLIGAATMASATMLSSTQGGDVVQNAQEWSFEQCGTPR